MPDHTRPILLKHQHGIALLVMVIAIALSVIAWFVSSLSIDEVKAERELRTQQVLKQAKEALIAYAVTYADRGAAEAGEFGVLPCPDTTAAGTEGASETCGDQYVNSVGYLPWISIESPVLSDNAGTCLLYAVSGSYKNTPRPGMINQNTNGQFQIMDDDGNVLIGSDPEDRIVAIVFAPGEVLEGQSRTFDDTTVCGGDYGNWAEYLEGDGATDNSGISTTPDAIDQFIHSTWTSATEATPYNDKFITISRNEIWSAILQRSDLEKKLNQLTEALAVCLTKYAAESPGAVRRLPWPAPVDLSDFRDSDDYDDEPNAGAGYAGRFPFYVDSSNSTIGFSITTPPISNLRILEMHDYCDSIDLPSTAGVADDISLKANTEYGSLYKHWKDRFFYVLSKDYEPGTGSEGSCSSNCVSMNGAANKVAAIVFYAGRALGAQKRNSQPPDDDPDDKPDIANYLEENYAGLLPAPSGNANRFPDNTGDANYETGLSGSNDKMFCITDEASGAVLNVVPCENY